MLKHRLSEHLTNTNSAFNVISCFQLFTFLYPSNPGICTLPMQHKLGTIHINLTRGIQSRSSVKQR